MQTKIRNAQDAINVLNENLEGLLVGDRAIDLAKEVNNTVGKMTAIVKTQLIYKAMTNSPMEIEWLECSESALIAN